jgi:CheY-like chemotaxis protein
MGQVNRKNLLNPESPIVFVVDDDIRSLRIVSHFLSKTCYEVHGVSSAEAALRWLETVTPDVILIDINLPGKDGFGILQDVKNNANLQNTKNVAFTSFAQAGDEERFISAGFDYYLSKPICKNNLIELLRNILEQLSIKPRT